VIVTSAPAATSVAYGADGGRAELRPLAQPVLLRSRTEAFDHLRLPPDAHHTRPAGTTAETAWYVLRGPVLAEQLPSGAHLLAGTGDLLLIPRGSGVRLAAGPLGAELLSLTLDTPPARPRTAHPRRRTRP